MGQAVAVRGGGGPGRRHGDRGCGNGGRGGRARGCAVRRAGAVGTRRVGRCGGVPSAGRGERVADGVRPGTGSARRPVDVRVGGGATAHPPLGRLVGRPRPAPAGRRRRAVAAGRVDRRCRVLVRWRRPVGVVDPRRPVAGVVLAGSAARSERRRRLGDLLRCVPGRRSGRARDAHRVHPRAGGEDRRGGGGPSGAEGRARRRRRRSARTARRRLAACRRRCDPVGPGGAGGDVGLLPAGRGQGGSRSRAVDGVRGRRRRTHGGGGDATDRRRRPGARAGREAARPPRCHLPAVHRPVLVGDAVEVGLCDEQRLHQHRLLGGPGGVEPRRPVRRRAVPVVLRVPDSGVAGQAHRVGVRPDEAPALVVLWQHLGAHVLRLGDHRHDEGVLVGDETGHLARLGRRTRQQGRRLLRLAAGRHDHELRAGPR